MKKKLNFYCIFQKDYIDFYISLLNFFKKVFFFKILTASVLNIIYVNKLLTKRLMKIN